MAFYEEKKRELEELLKMISREKAHFTDIAQRERKDIDSKMALFQQQQEELEKTRYAIVQLARQKSQGFPWLAQAYDDYFRLRDLEVADNLKTKAHPAPKAAEEHRQIATERREAEKAARITNYLLEYCRFLAPWLDEYIGMETEELDVIIREIHAAWSKREEEFVEEVKRQVGPKKYEALTPSQRLQRALDWYWEKPDKSNWQIGRDYERCVGYLYEQKGWNVYYHGKKGYEDLGRDLVCKRGNSVEIVQCKCWAREKTIHEKHIYYLFGTTVEYFLENFGDREDLQLALFPSLIQERQVVPKLVTTIDVSPKAAQVARVLGVAIEKTPFQRYPSVKCNVSRRTGEKIYHLPFDQQYDTTLIEEERLECYVETIAEAEALGFRHAFRWRGETSG